MLTPKQKADIDAHLKILVIAINADFGSMIIRESLNPIGCMIRGYVNKSGKGDFNVAKKDAPKSDGYHLSSKHTCEHLVPLKVMVEEIKSRGVSEQNILDVIHEMWHVVKVSDKEDDALNSAKVKQNMPGEFYDPSSTLYKNIAARHIKAKIFSEFNLK